MAFSINISASARDHKPGSIYWVNEKLHLYPELSWLLQPNHKYSQGISHENNKSWSKEISGVNSVEFEKTVTTLLCLELIFDGSKEAYTHFVLPQTEDKLTYTNFNKLHNFALSLARSNHTLSKQLLEKNIIIRDVGKSDLARDMVKNQCNITDADPHFFIRKVLKNCTKIFPSFFTLSDIQKKVIIETDIFHFGHISHLEGGPEMLSALKKANLDKSILDLKLLTDIVETAGCLGHIDNRGSLLFTQKISQITWAVINMLRSLDDKDEKEALKIYIKLRAKWLGFNQNVEEDLVLTKIGTMMRLTSKQQGRILKKAFSNLNSNQRHIIFEQLNPLIYRNEKTPTYMPTILRNFYQKQVINKTTEESLEETVNIIVPFLATVIKYHRNIIKGLSIEKQPILSFNIAANQIHEGFQISSNAKFDIQNGIVLLKY